MRRRRLRRSPPREHRVVLHRTPALLDMGLEFRHVRLADQPVQVIVDLRALTLGTLRRRPRLLLLILSPLLGRPLGLVLAELAQVAHRRAYLSLEPGLVLYQRQQPGALAALGEVVGQ